MENKTFYITLILMASMYFIGGASYHYFVGQHLYDTGFKEGFEFQQESVKGIIIINTELLDLLASSKECTSYLGEQYYKNESVKNIIDKLMAQSNELNKNEERLD